MVSINSTRAKKERKRRVRSDHLWIMCCKSSQKRSCLSSEEKQWNGGLGWL